MIIQDQAKLRIPCRETTLEECRALDVFNKLDTELNTSPVGGYGLAANQIGLDIRACTIHPKDRNKYDIIHMINPVVFDLVLPIISQGEGCLSLPGVRLNTNRFEQCTCTWMDYGYGKPQTAVFYGLPAIVIQHEVDHLNGILLFDRQVTRTVGRNDLCPCGSGKKYKKCCLR